jgi:uncharacterized short protein YbdD (DUF466 family)
VNAAWLVRWVARSWRFLRDLTGDAAYDVHLAHARAREERPQTREDFYMENLRRKYSRPNRCC